MALIDSEEKARRLGRAILADIQLYNAETIAGGGDLGPVIAEGRELYRSRVAPGLHPLFEAMIEEAPFNKNPTRLDAPHVDGPPAAPSAASETTPRWIAIAALLVVLGALLYVYFAGR